MSIILDNKKGKLLQFLSFNPTTSYTIRELSRQTKISPTWISKIARQLEKEKIVETKADANSLKVKAIRENPFLRLKRVINLHGLYNSGIVDELNKDYLKPEAIILFGSYARGEDTEESDIDIAVLAYRKDAGNNYAQYEKRLKRKLSVQIINPKNLTKEFALSLANGIVLYGYFEAEL